MSKETFNIVLCEVCKEPADSPVARLCMRHYRPNLGPTEELLNQRGKVYGDVRNNMLCAYDLIQVWMRHRLGSTQDNTTISHDMCISMVMHKLARICTGNLNEDNYKDVAGYIELARKIAMGEPTKVDTT